VAQRFDQVKTEAPNLTKKSMNAVHADGTMVKKSLLHVAQALAPVGATTKALISASFSSGGSRSDARGWERRFIHLRWVVAAWRAASYPSHILLDGEKRSLHRIIRVQHNFKQEQDTVVKPRCSVTRQHEPEAWPSPFNLSRCGAPCGMAGDRDAETEAVEA